MGAPHWKTLLAVGTACAALAGPLSNAAFAKALPQPQVYGSAYGSPGYDRGYREGVQQGERDARDRRAFSIESNRVYRDGDRGWDRGDGDRNSYRNEFRRGFSSGYRDGYDRVNVAGRRNDRVYGDNGVYRDGRWEPGTWGNGSPRARGGYQEPAYARGYSDGWQQGANDGRDRDRYDPSRHGEYKSADHGYDRNYGPKDTYKNNYRSGFRQGYEEGYRNGNRTARR
jgi:hypothetical protein